MSESALVALRECDLRSSQDLQHAHYQRTCAGVFHFHGRMPNFL